MTYYKSRDLASRDAEMNVFQNGNIRSRGVAELDVVEIDYSLDALRLYSRFIEWINL